MMIRKAAIKDWDSIVGILTICFKEEFAYRYGLPIEKLRMFLKALYLDRDIWVCEKDGDIVGVLFVSSLDTKTSSWFDQAKLILKYLPIKYLIKSIVFFFNPKLLGEGIAHIDRIAIKPEYQGKAIGKELLAFAEKLASDYGKERISLMVDYRNKAKHFYEHAGYSVNKEISSWPLRVSLGFEKALVMEKRIKRAIPTAETTSAVSAQNH